MAHMYSHASYSIHVLIKPGNACKANLIPIGDGFKYVFFFHAYMGRRPNLRAIGLKPLII